MRLIFLGSGEFALPTLAFLVDSHDVVAVVTQPDRPAGRKRKVTATPVADWSEQRGLNVLKIRDVNKYSTISRIENLQPDASIVIAFGQKLAPQLIQSLGRIAINLHASLLPQYRGAAPINWAVINNESVTGVSVIGIAPQMDAGEIYAQLPWPINALETAGQLHDRLADLGPAAVNKVLADLASDTLCPRTQHEEAATKAPKLTRADGTIDFSQSAQAVRARVHGLTPWPGCWVHWTSQATGHTSPLRLMRVRDYPDPPDSIKHQVTTDKMPAGSILDGYHVLTGVGTIKLLEVQAPGTRSMGIDAFAHGHQLYPGDTLAETHTKKGV